MSPHMMFSALAVSVAALGLSACGDSPPPAPLQNPSQTSVPVAMAQASYPATSPDEPLTANTAARTYHSNFSLLQSVPVKGMDACMEAAKAGTYLHHIANSENGGSIEPTYTSCVAADGKARMNYVCSKPNTSPHISCRPF